MNATRALVGLVVGLVAVLPCGARGQDLVVDGMSPDVASRAVTLGGVRRYDTVRVVRGGTITVAPFDGVDRINTGNLELRARSIVVDATSTITARGSGYSTIRCGDGRGPTTRPSAGGRGGCSVRDSGGGGAHFGRGGRGTIDAPTAFPRDFEEDCGNTLSGMMCTSVTNCRTRDDGLPTVAGAGWFHSIYDIEFGASGGDKGCRDGDGFGAQPMVGGPGGGRIVLVALTSEVTGTIQIDGLVTANGRRGCGTGNDSGGGGAGGSIFVVGDQVTIGTTGRVTAAGGIGGDTFSAAVGQPDYLDCPPGAQTGGLCDDCGGGGGGGIIAVQSRVASFADGATFDVGGATGGVCPICRGEAGGGAGELQLDGLYVGEICDGYDNDFDDRVDEGLGTTGCGIGACASTLPLCDVGRGEPSVCAPTTTDATCFAERDAARPRVAVILDTSASMLLDLAGYPTFGDGSVEHPGLDTDGDGQPNDSRLALARESLASVVSAYPEIDFALARYTQDMAENRFCQNAAWFECAGIVGTYDDPRDNTGALACNVSTSATTTVPVRRVSMGDECINYAGSCGAPRRGADILSGFGTRTRDLVRWLDGRETRFIDDETTGDVCQHSRGGDCEVRGAGPTPLAGSLEAIEDYITPIRATDAQRSCRTYSVILVTDGAESCNGEPVSVARELHDVYGIEVYVIAVSVRAEEEASLNAIARRLGGSERRDLRAPPRGPRARAHLDHRGLAPNRALQWRRRQLQRPDRRGLRGPRLAVRRRSAGRLPRDRSLRLHERRARDRVPDRDVRSLAGYRDLQRDGRRLRRRHRRRPHVHGRLHPERPRGLQWPRRQLQRRDRRGRPEHRHALPRRRALRARGAALRPGHASLRGRHACPRRSLQRARRRLRRNRGRAGDVPWRDRLHRRRVPARVRSGHGIPLSSWLPLRNGRRRLVLPSDALCVVRARRDLRDGRLRRPLRRDRVRGRSHLPRRAMRGLPRHAVRRRRDLRGLAMPAGSLPRP
jgi:hypothetical protein